MQTVMYHKLDKIWGYKEALVHFFMEMEKIQSVFVIKYCSENKGIMPDFDKNKYKYFICFT